MAEVEMTRDPAAEAPVKEPDPVAAAAPQEQTQQDEKPNVTPEEQAEYERVSGAMHTMLYTNEKVPQSIVDQIVPEEKVGSVIKISLTFIQELDKKIDMDEEVVAQITTDLVEEVLQIAEAGGHEFSQQEAEQALMAVYEQVQAMFGGEGSIQEDFDIITQGMSPENIQSAQSMAQSLYDEGGTITPEEQQAQAQQAQQQAQQQQAQQQQAPQQGAPQQGAPQQAPPQAPPRPPPQQAAPQQQAPARPPGPPVRRGAG